MVSIVLPVYNCEKYLRRSLSCAVNQTYLDIEIILVENGSTDSSLDICKEFADKDKRIRLIIAGSNIGAGEARNIGIEKATGSYICFLDSDDWYETNLVEKLIVAVSADDYDVGICAYEAYVEDGSKLDHHTCRNICLKSDLDVKEYFLNCFPDGHVGFLWNKIYKTSVIKENNIRFPSLSRLEDGFFNLKFFEIATSCVVISDELYHYRISGAKDVVVKHNADYADLVISLTDETLDAHNNWGVDVSEDEVYKFCLNELGTCIENTFLGGWKMSAKGKNDYLRQLLYIDTYDDAYSHLELVGKYRQLLHKFLHNEKFLALRLVVFIKTFFKKYLVNLYYTFKR